MKPAQKIPAKAEAPKKNTLAEIQRLQRERDERRRLMEQAKQERAAEEQRNKENGTPGDVDFQRMIRQFRDQLPEEQPHANIGELKICICVRKRPISQKEIRKNEYDSVTCTNPLVIVHDCKLKVDGISKYLENTSFEFDHTFHEESSTEDVYVCAVQSLAQYSLEGGRSTVFAYGQTGSGKTFTMQGIQNFLAEDLFYLINNTPKFNQYQVFVTYFEIYGGRCQDLLNNREKLNIREDGNGEVIVSDLMEIEAESAESLHTIIDLGNRNRTTHATESNDVSSRSHAVCQISIKQSNGRLMGKLSLIDLAGSERGADTKSHNRQRRMEGAEINKSLLALKECIRALDGGSSHVPYRASKLTLVLKDSFTRQGARTVMICNVSPSSSSADHTLNTLRYADRVKERTVGSQAARNAAMAAGGVIAPSKAMMPSRDDNRRLSAPSDVRGNRPMNIESKFNDLSMDDDYMHQVDRDGLDDDLLRDEDGDEALLVDELHRTVQDLFEEEETLLNLHMNVIQESAELLTEEGRLLQQIQGDDYDIDAYATRLDNILQRKQELIQILQDKLKDFRQKLAQEEMASKRLAGHIPSY